MRIKIKLLVLLFLTMSCQSSKDKLQSSITIYLKKQGLLVEDVSLISVEPMNKKEYGMRVQAEIIRESPFATIMEMERDDTISGVEASAYDALSDQKVANDKKVNAFYYRIEGRPDRNDFAYDVFAQCKYEGRDGKTKEAQIEFLLSNESDPDVLLCGGEKYWKQRWRK